MSDREYFRKRAEIERTAAIMAKDRASRRVHMNMAREYDWRASTEPPADPLKHHHGMENELEARNGAAHAP